MEIYGYIATILMGLSLGMIGGGGSILTVPILVYFFSFNPVAAASNSLFIVGLTAFIGFLISNKNKEVEFKTGLLFAIPSFLGVYITKSIILPMIPDPILSFYGLLISKSLLIMVFFAGLMLLASFSMIFKKKKQIIVKTLKPSENFFTILKQGLIVGSVTGLVGAGGGFLIVPALVNLLGLSMRKAIGTSLMIIAANSLFGFLLFLQRGEPVNWYLLVTLLGIALVGLIAGSYYSKKVPEDKLKKGFGFFVLIMGTLIFIDQIFKM